MQKQRKHIVLSAEAEEYIEAYRKNHGCSFSSAVDSIILEHRARENGEADEIAARVVAAFDSKYSAALTRIRLGVNGADRQTQMMMEMLNSMCCDMKINYYASDLVPSDAIKGAKKTVDQRIANFKQKKDNKK